MFASILQFFSSGGFVPHGFCLTWRPDVFWMNVVGDGLTALSYFSMTLAILYYTQHRRDEDFRWLLLTFSAFIITCASTHAISIWTLWVPDYSVEALLKFVTGLVALATVAIVWLVMPQALAMPTRRQMEGKNAELFELNRQLTATVEALAREVGERKQAEDELFRSRQMLQLVLNTIPQRVFWKSRDLTYLGSNHTFAEDAGVEAAEAVIGKSDFDFAWKTLAEAYRDDDLQVMTSGKPKINYEEPLAGPDGSARWARTSKIPMRDREDVVIGVLGTYEDITERKAAEEELRRERQHLQDTRYQLEILTKRLTLATQSGRIGVWEWVPGTEYPLWDAQMFKLYDIDPQQEVFNFDLWRKRVHPDDLARAETEIADALAGRQPFDTEFRIVTPAGELRTIRAVGTVERGATGQPLLMIGANWDISAIRQNEQALEFARREAEQSSRAKSAFVANMSHEIRTPMNAITGLIYLLEQTELSAVQRDYVNKTRLSAQALLGILNDILDFSKVEAGRLELEQTTFLLDDLMKSLATITAANARDKDIEVLFHIAPGTPRSLVGDPLRLQQVLMNLASNAIKFTHAGEVVLSVEADRVDAETVDLTFAVRDTGIGIDAVQRSQIFEAFSQGDTSTTRHYGGSGLGLAICKRLVGLMGGDIRVDSQPGVGSTFRFTARFGRGPDMATTPGRPPDLPHPLRVLLVDDNSTAREVMAAMIAPFGWAVEVVASGREALAAIDRTVAEHARFDLVLLDWRMPEVTGRDVLRHVEERYPAATLPMILVVTAFEQDLVRREAGEDPAVRLILTKPVTPSILLDAVTTCCSTGADAGIRLPPPPTVADGRRLAGVRLLLVEDNAINQMVARRILESVGAEVTVVGSGVDAVSMLAADDRRFDAVLMDVQMPGMDGYEATRRIRRDLGLVDLPIIAMTANALPADRERALAAGMNDHVGKPIDVEVLVATLATHMPTADPPAASPPQPPDRPPDGDATWQDIPGIDGKEACRRLNGDRQLFALLLGQLAEQFGDVVVALRAELIAGKSADALRRVHTLLGVASNLAARDVATLARSLEAAIREDRFADAETLLVALDVTLSELLAAISNTVSIGGATMLSIRDT